MKIRSSQTLVFTQQEQDLVGFNYLTKSTFGCTPQTIEYLAMLGQWTELEEATGLMQDVDPEIMRENIDSLINATAITEEDSTLTTIENEYQKSWSWGVPAALFHFSLKDKPFLSNDEIELGQREKAAINPSPPLYTRNKKYKKIVQLDKKLNGSDLLQLMARRRTVREVDKTSISQEQLSDCLFSGMGITGYTHNCVGQLPLSMTPSGGARNPYEAYIYARHVEGLEPGFYHYSAIEHSLGRLPSDHLPKPSQLLAGQEWADEMPCIMFLAAMFDRTMWKYVDANAYRGVLIEAGHIGQNVMLAATKHKLTACPTGAFCHTPLHNCLNLSGANQTVIYALALGSPKKDETTKMYQ